jgi:hypothetical protein
VDFDGALRELQLHCAIVQIQKGNARLAGEANAGGADVNFAARIFVGPEVITSGERPIDISLEPILFAGGLKGDGALNVIQARDARWGIGHLCLGLRCVVALILVLGCCVLRQREKQGRNERQKNETRKERELSGHELDPFVVRIGTNIAILRNQLAAKNHANQSTMRVSDMAAQDLHVRNPIMEL